MCNSTPYLEIRILKTKNSLLKRRQIRASRACAVATAHLLRQVVKTHRAGDVSRLIQTVRDVGQRLISAQHKELAIGNILRRILRVIRDEAEEEREWETTAADDAEVESRTDTPRGDNITSANNNDTLSQPTTEPNLSPPLHQSSEEAPYTSEVTKGIRAEIVDGIDEIIDELDQVDEQIAGYALEHIHSNEILLTHASSITVQKFLLKAAAKRKFTLFHAESFPNDHEATHAAVTGRSKITTEDETNYESFHKPLAAAGITVVLIPDSAVFAVMSRVNKVILDTNVVLANGGLVASAGSKAIAKAAKYHRTPVVVLSGVYQLSPENPSNVNSLIEYGDASKVFVYEDGNLVNHLDVVNPLHDYVPPELVDLFITNL